MSNFSSEDNTKFNVVVIGAGISGLGAARWLKDNDVDKVICSFLIYCLIFIKKED
jgi:cation diffusion facilitator CzcD-associated flavoprotein CzcO